MYGIRTAVIADPSPVGQQLLALLLRQHCERVLVAADGEAAWQAVQSASGPALVLVDMALPPPNGALALLERCAARGAERPAFIAVTTRPSIDEETRVTLLGAIGYLAKPISYRDLATSLRARQISFGHVAPRARAHPLTRVEVCDSGKTPQLWWDVNDLSETGAFLVTRAAIPVGTRLELLLHLDAERVHVSAEVVRVQQPSWAQVGGVGVAFRGAPEETSAKLARFVEAALRRGH